MLIEVKAKVARVIDNKTRKRSEVYVVDKELFAEAEYRIMSILAGDQETGSVDSYEIVSLRQSPIKEVASQFTGNCTFIATLKDIWLADDGTEKSLKYKVLLWADTPSQAMSNTLQIVHQGYDMQVEGIKQVDYEYLTETPGVTNNEEEENDDNS